MPRRLDLSRSGDPGDATEARAEPGGSDAGGADALRRQRYTELLGAHGRGLAQVVGSYARRAADREDLVQDLALALWRALPEYRVEASLKVFAYRIATNLAISYLRSRRRIEPERETIDAAPSPEAALDHADQRRALRRAIVELPLSLRQVVVLRLEGLRYAEIGEVLGLSEKNVSVRLTRARQQLRAHLGVPS